ncbi:MAG: peptidoglycan DD-metalloendopeptidase family protein [Lachnospiraceae bacterium]|nr:peptidoglycan DD-metalloendopeptidase family protein [Lachnospiraceae bacterium]
MSMRRNRNGVRKERIIMLTSSVLVLAALTVTGVFVRSNRQADEGSNVVDFSAIESGVSDTAENILSSEDMSALFADVGTDDLDYDPSFQEANSGNVENSDTDKNENKGNKKSGSNDAATSDTKENKNEQDKTSTKADNKKSDDNENGNNEEGMFDESQETISEMPEDTEAIATTVQPMLDFSEDDGLVWPIVGDILLNYSMDKTIYFPTLQQYKYHPAIVISATEGETITAAADGRVISVNYDPQLGNTVVMDLGNQYELTYGQLDNITVSEGSYVVTGDIIGNVASPTKYYSLEGANVYFKLTKDGEPVNPLQKLN